MYRLSGGRSGFFERWLGLWVTKYMVGLMDRHAGLGVCHLHYL